MGIPGGTKELQPKHIGRFALKGGVFVVASCPIRVVQFAAVAATGLLHDGKHAAPPSFPAIMSSESSDGVAVTPLQAAVAHNPTATPILTSQACVIMVDPRSQTPTGLELWPQDDFERGRFPAALS